MTNIQPKCKALPGNGGEDFHLTHGNIYISAQGYVFPCCWYNHYSHTKSLWEDSGIDRKYHNIHFYSLEEIINGPIFKWIEDNMSSANICKEKCTSTTI